MKSWRIVSGFFLMFLGVGALPAATPEEDLRDAVDRLWAAGNYSWEQGHDTSPDGHKPTFRRAVSDWGETNIGGFTAANTRKDRVVFNDNEKAILLNRRWRHVDDLTLSDREELAGYRHGKVAERNVPTFSSIPALPHELLRVLLGSTKNVRQQGPAIVADLAPPFHDHVHFVGYLATKKNRPLFAGRPEREGKAELVVWLDKGTITDFTIQFSTASSNWFFVKLAKIGTTTVEIDPEAEALFLGRRASP